jgi:DNA-directed RNA polymerase subunit E'/Rpb7
MLIEKRVCIRPEFLDSNVMKYIEKKVHENYINDCTKDIGYITSIKKIVKIKDNYLSNSCSDIVFEVIIDVENIKPEVGSIFKGNVCMIFQDGILVNIQNIMKVLIPLSSLKDYNLIGNQFVLNKEKYDINNKYVKIKLKDDVKVKIIGSKYTRKNYACFGELC